MVKLREFYDFLKVSLIFFYKIFGISGVHGIFCLASRKVLD